MFAGRETRQSTQRTSTIGRDNATGFLLNAAKLGTGEGFLESVSHPIVDILVNVPGYFNVDVVVAGCTGLLHTAPSYYSHR